MPYVVVQKKGAVPPLAKGFVAERDLREGTTGDTLDWSDVCTQIAKDAIDTGETSPFNVFLLIDNAEIETHDQLALKAVIKQARDRCWGARLHLVLLGASPIADMKRGSIASLGDWIEESLAGRVSELIQMPEPMRGHSPAFLWQALYDRASEIKQRQINVGVAAGSRLWRCALPRNLKETARRFGPRAFTDPDKDTGSDLIIVLSTSTPRDQVQQVERYLKTPLAMRRRTCRVVTHKRGPSDALTDCCKANGLDRPLRVEGDFELWYLLLRLNENAPLEHVDHESVQPVHLARSPAMKRPVPSVLLTSVFGHNEPEQWLLAAEEVGELLLGAPFELEFRVELAIDPDRLRDIVDSMSTVSAWIHIGHGRGRWGLWVPNKESLLPPDQWSPCFSNRELRLALFLTCDSHDIAKHFAEQGAGVAVGFEGKVEANMTRKLSVQILQAMLADGMHADSIIAGFQNGTFRFTSLQNLKAKPRAYYPRRS